MKSACLRFFAISLGLLVICITRAQAADSVDIPALIDQLENGDPQEQVLAANELAEEAAQARPAIPALIAALGSDQPELRLAAARTLGALSSAAEDAVPQLIELVSSDPEPTVRALAAWSLGQISIPADQIGPALVHAVTDEDAMVRRSALRSLNNLDIDRGDLREVWLEVLTDSDPAVIMPALDSLAELGAQAVPPLTDALGDPRTAYWACLVLSEIGPDAEPAAPALAEVATGSDEPETRMQALLALGEIGPGAAGQIATIETGLDDEHEAVRYAATYAIGRIGSASEAAQDKLRAMTEHDDEFLRMMSAWAIAVLNPSNEQDVQLAVDRLTAGMQSDDPQVRSVAVTALVQGQFPTEIVRPALLDVLDDVDPQVLAIGLNAIVAQGAAAVPRLEDALDNPQLRPLAIEALGRIGPDSDPAVDDLVELLEGDDLELAAEVQFALARIGPNADEAIPELIESLSSEDPLIRSSACYALGRIGEPDIAAQRALVQLIKDAQTPEEKLPAVWALLQMRPESDRLQRFALPILMHGLHSEAEFIRAESATALGRMGEAAVPALEDLREALLDHSPIVRQAAAQAILSIES